MRVGDIVTADAESLTRIVADIDAWCNDGSDTCEQPIDFICDLRERLDGLRRFAAATPAGDREPPTEPQA